MKRSFFTIVLLTAFYVSGFSQWQEKNILSGEDLTSVHFVSNEIGYVAGANSIFKTTDGGNTWAISLSAGSSVFFEEIFAIDENMVVAVGKDFSSTKSIVIRTINGGMNWQSMPVPGNAFLKSVYFISPNVGYCSGSEGTILKSTDGGSTWQAQNTGISQNLESICFFNGSLGLAVGGSPVSAVLLKTNDAGGQWNSVDVPSNSNLQSVFFTSEQVAYVVGWNGEILKTDNGGADWFSQNSVSMSGNLDVVFTDTQTGYITGGLSNAALIQKTINGGQTWEDVSPATGLGLISISFPSFDVGYAVGNNGSVVKTVTGGTSGAGDLSFNPFIRIHPNPVSEKLWITSEENEPFTQVKLYDSNGKLIQAVKPNGWQAEMDLSHLPPNVYFLEIHTAHKEFIKKIVKK